MKSHGSVNRVYRLIWSEVLNGWVPVAESGRGRGKGSSRKLIAAALSLSAAFAGATPVGGQVVSGAGSVTQSGTTTTIQQASQNLSLNWKSFNIAPQESVNFVQPSASAIAVNRIFDTSGTKIFGQLNANGQVYLINPNGILFGQGAQVNVGGLVATTLDFNDTSLSGNTKTFSGSGSGSIVNQGTINATGLGGTGGYVALLGNTVSNQGTITAQRGSVALGAGSAATLTFQNNSLVKMQVDQSVLNSLAENSGLIRADGGMIVMNAGAKDALLASVVNNTGVIEARGVNTTGGVIRLEGGYVTQLGTIDTSGTTGGSIAVHARAILDTGTANVNGTVGSGGNISYTATDGIVQPANAQLTANGPTNGGSIHLQGNNSLFSSAKLSATGAQGGTVNMLGNTVILAAASIDASGATHGGLIRVGGDFHGANPNILNAKTTTLNGATLLKADGGNGKVVVWSDTQTSYYGNISANRAGSIEVSSKGTLIYAGKADAGAGGSLLLDPANIIISDAGGPAAFALLDPHPAAGNQFGSNTTLLGTTVNGVFAENGKIAIGSPNDSLGGISAGAFYLFDTNTGALLSALTGSRANDQVGDGATALANGNYAVRSSSWNDRMGAVTWGSGVNGVSGAVTASNSLIGTLPNDIVGRDIIALGNGNYVVESSQWNGGMGAVTWGNGATTGVRLVGAVSSSNSLVGVTAGDEVGQSIMPLANGNYAVFSTGWNDSRGAVTLGSGTSGVSGAVSSSNSLVGSTANDQVGNGGRDFTELQGVNAGKYVVGSPYWNGGIGAVTWLGSGTSGVVSASNSLVGTTAGDQVGSSGITALNNGNYVVGSSSWNVGRGAATWGDGATGISGNVAVLNSLVGTSAFDGVGGSITELANGNYVVGSSGWNVGRGAATWGDGATTGVRLVGAVNAGNSLVGTIANDDVGGFGVTALANGNYVVNSPGWNNAGAADAGAVTWGSGATSGFRLVGAVSASNSLVGTTAGDQVGGSISVAGSPTHGGGITELANGNYVVASPEWNGTRGAVTWGNGASGISGPVSAGNSLVGAAAGDFVGGGDRATNYVTALANGNYVVISPEWNNTMGAVTWGNGATGGARLIGAVSASNSLVGTVAGDYVGRGDGLANSVTRLANGNYVVGSVEWNGRRGAVTWGNGASGISGAVSASNSLVGTSVGDGVGEDISALANGNYVVRSNEWNVGRGASTWGNGTTAGARLIGEVSAGNSLVGVTAGDNVGGRITELANGNYLVMSSDWNGGMGATTWGNGAAGGARLVGAVSASNSLVGTTAGDQVGDDAIALANGNYVVLSRNYAADAGQVLIGTPFNLSFANGTGQNMIFNSSALTATLAGGTAVTLQASNDITVNSAIAVGGSAGGAFTLQAGRNINLNSTLTTANGDFTAIAGDPSAISADRLPGTPTITLGAGASINAGTGTVILVANGGNSGGNFVNNSGSATPISASRWLVYSTSPAGSTENGMTAAAGSTSPRLYNKTFSGNPPQTIATGNHLIYSAQPTLIVKADDKSRLYGGTNPAFTTTISGFVSDDGVTDTAATVGLAGAGSATSTATETSPVAGSPYVITASTGDLSSTVGYAIRAANGALTIDKASLTVTADDKSRLYGAANPALTTTVSGFVNNETAGTAAGFAGAGSATTTAVATANVGAAVITGSTGNLAASNYAFAAANGTLTINPAAPPVNSGLPPEPVLNAMAQLQSEALFYRMNNEPQTLNLSSTISVTQSASTGSAASSSESINPAAGSTRMNVNTLMNVNTIVMGPSLQIMNIGATGTTLQIVNGGMRLPDTLANEN